MGIRTVGPHISMFGVLLALLLLLGRSVNAQPVIIATVPVGGQGPNRVAVNSTTNRIYTANFSSSNVAVIDGAINTLVTTIYVGGQPYGIAVNSITNRIYVTDLMNLRVSVIDGATNTVIATIPVGNQAYDRPYGIAVNPVTNRIYVTNWFSLSVSVIDGATNTVIAGISVLSYGGNPYGVGVNSTTNRIYVTTPLSSSVAVINGATNAVVATVPVCQSPLGVDVNLTSNRIYVANSWDGTVSVINGATNSVLATVLAGNNFTSGVAVNSTTNRIYVTMGNSVAVIEDPPFIPVSIDIKPGSFPNSINLKSEGVLPVAILTTSDFNALEVDKATARLGDPRLSGTAAPIRSTAEDVDGDGDLDLLLFFRIPDLASNGALDANSTEAVLTGATYGGIPISGSDSVRIVPS